VHSPMLRNRLVLVGGSLAIVGCAAFFSNFVVRRGIWTRLALANTATGSDTARKMQAIKEAMPSRDLVANLGRYRVIDVREPNERVESGFVPSSVNIPLGNILDDTTKVADDKPLLLVCRSGKRSMRAAETLQGRGYQDLTNLTGGTMGWIDAGLPVDHVKSEPIKEILPSQDLEKRLSEYLIIDVRLPQELVETGFVPGAINLPLPSVMDGTAEIPKSDKPLLIVCRSGARSMKASEALASRGYDPTNLASGTLGWIQAGLKVDH